MAKLSRCFARHDSGLVSFAARCLPFCSAAVAALLLAACARDVDVEIENTQAAREVARLSRPAGSVYIGWRVFQDRCASCHGLDATGAGAAPDLLPIVQQLGPRSFLSLVLKRYDWDLAPAQVAQGHDASNSLIEDVMQRKEPPIAMPAWEGSPAVSAHIADLYAYLSARTEGLQGKGRPLP